MRPRKKLTPAQEILLYDLRKQGKSGQQISDLVARGHDGHEPFNVSAAHAREVARRIMDERGELYDSDLAKGPPNKALEAFARRMLHVADREIDRLERSQRHGKLDGNKLAALATAVSRLHTLIEKLERDKPADPNDPAKPPAPPGPNGAPTPSSKGSDWIAEQVAEANRPVNPVPSPEPIADRKLPPSATLPTNQQSA